MRTIKNRQSYPVKVLVNGMQQYVYIFDCDSIVELRKSLMLLQWYYLLPYFLILASSTMFYFIAGSVDPGFVPSDTDNVIMIAYEVEFLRICLTISENSV